MPTRRSAVYSPETENMMAKKELQKQDSDSRNAAKEATGWKVIMSHRTRLNPPDTKKKGEPLCQAEQVPD